jgi:WD40 repeat protein
VTTAAPGPADRLRAWARAQAGTAPAPRAPARPAGWPPRPVLGPDIAPRLTREISGHRTGVPAVDFAVAPDGTPLLATGGHDDTVRIWDLVTGEGRHLLDNQGRDINDLRFARLADGTCWLLSVGDGGGLKIWDPVAGTLVRELPVEGDGWSVDTALPADRRPVAATVGASGVTRIWDLAAGTCLHELPASPPAEGRGTSLLALDTGDCLVASSFTDGRLRTWTVYADGRTGSPGCDIPAWRPPEEPGRVYAVCFVPPAGTRPPLVVTATRNRATVWDPATGEYQRDLDGHTRLVVGAAALALADGRRIVATVAEDDTVRFWDADTGACLHTLPVGVADSGSTLWCLALRALDDGTVLLAVAGGAGRAWVFTLSGERGAAPSRPAASEPGSRTAAEWTVTERPAPPDLAGHTGHVNSLAAVALDDGTALLASGSDDRTVRAWDLRSGACRYVVDAHGGEIWATAFAPGPRPGAAILATGARDDRGVFLWDALTGQPAAERPPPRADRRIYSVAVHPGPGGQPVVASVGGSLDGADYGVEVWAADTGAGHGPARAGEIYAVALGRLADGTMLVVTEGPGHEVAVSGTDLATWDSLLQDGPIRSVTSLATGQALDGGTLIAAGCGDHTVRLWDAATRAPRLAITCDDRVCAVRLAEVSGGAWLLATMTATRVALWDPETGRQLWSRTDEAMRASRWTSPDPLAVAAAGDQVWVAYGIGDQVRVAVLEVHGPRATAAAESAVPESAADRVAWEAAVAGLPALAEAGIGGPLGLLAGLVELTSRDEAAGGGVAGRLAPLAGSPGLARLRSLGWPAASRVALAALLLADVPVPDRFAPPAVPAGELYAALRAALASPLPGREPFGVPVAALTAAAETVTPATTALLGLLGPAAVAGDPLLPLRLRHYEAALPALDPAALSTLSGLPRQVTGALAERAYSVRSAAGTVGLHRHGSPASLVRSQLALPDDVLTLRLVSGDLLYRLHEGEPEPVLEPVTIVLDTTPPTFGPVEAVLRLAAHVMAAVLLAAGVEAALVVLDAPGRAEILRRPGDLMRVWATRTLQPPALAPALATAAAVGYPVVAVLTTHHLARGYPLIPGPPLRVLTTHAPGEAPRVTAGPYRAHVPPGAPPPDIAAAVARILSRAYR